MSGFGRRDFLDKSWITVDNFAGSGDGNVYLVARNFGGGGHGSRPDGIYLSRSTNDGLTWMSPLRLTGATTQGANVVVGPDHSVYVFYWSTNGFSDRLMMRKSTNQGQSFGSAVTVASLQTSSSVGDLGLEFRTNAFPQAAINPVNGNIYVVYNDDPAGADRGDIYFTESTNGGNSWSSPESRERRRDQQ